MEDVLVSKHGNPENDNYRANCVARGKKIAKADETCGDLWAEALSCAAELPCEEFLMWMYPHDTKDPEKEYPCKDEEDAFDAECGDDD